MREKDRHQAFRSTGKPSHEPRTVDGEAGRPFSTGLSGLTKQKNVTVFTNMPTKVRSLALPFTPKLGLDKGFHAV